MSSKASDSGLESFSAATRKWFLDVHAAPTAIQSLVWPRVAAGENLLATAPTGSGKTLAAFLWAIDCFSSGRWKRGGIQVLYVSPLKALNNDVQKNLLAPIAELGATILVGTRSGDTSPAERQRQKKQPPDILITTPESLNVLLTSQGGRAQLGGLKLVIVDEVHAVAASRRGTHLMTAIERLVSIAGDFQRIALSATVHPIEGVARWFAGHRVTSISPLGLTPRPISIYRAPQLKKYELLVTPLGGVSGEEIDSGAAVAGFCEKSAKQGELVWKRLAQFALERIALNRSTLIFASGRRAVEKITRFINLEAPGEEEVAYSHHGSLSKEVRAVVEGRLKSGRLKAIVATNSLELGIDIGALDEVIQVQTPHSVSSMVQRMGRAGHGVGETSRALLIPLFQRDLLGAMVLGKAALQGDFEATEPLGGGLDVLSQVLLSMTATESWSVDAAYAVIRSCDAYRGLSWQQYESVLEMLSGRYERARIRSLQARIIWDKVDGTISAKRGVAQLVYASGGTIADRGYFQLRLADTKAKLGELDEEFVWERRVGDRFAMGTRTWQIEKIDHNDVLVRSTNSTGAIIPFWRAESRDREFFLSEKIGEFLEQAEALLQAGRDSDLVRLIGKQYPVHEEAVTQVVGFLRRQRAQANASLPHRRHLLVEHYREAHNNQERHQLILHTLWGGRVNRPFAMALVSGWQKAYGQKLDVMHSDDCIVLSLVEGYGWQDLERLVRSDNLLELIRLNLGASGLLGAHFRERAGCALLLPKGDFRRRLPLWFNRMRSKKLMSSVSEELDFPITLESWRACLQESFDLPTLGELLDELADGSITVTEVETHSPTPFCSEIVWKLTNEEMYKDDRPDQDGGAKVGDDWLREVTLSASLRPRIQRALSEELEQKLQRTYPGYTPRDAEELLNWVQERVVVSRDEWLTLLAAMERDGNVPAGISPSSGEGVHEEAWMKALARKAKWVELAHGSVLVGGEVLQRLPLLEKLAQWADLFQEGEIAATVSIDEMSQIFREWLRFYGPTSVERMSAIWGLDRAQLSRILQPLVSADEVIIGPLHLDVEIEEICDCQNLETLLRWTRSRNRANVEPLALRELGLFWAQHQGLCSKKEGNVDVLRDVLEQLAAFGATAGDWEKEILPARLRPYNSRWLDEIFSHEELVWCGVEKEKIALVSPEELQLMPHGPSSLTEDAAASVIARLQLPERGRFKVQELSLKSGYSPAEVSYDLWIAAWEGQVSNDGYAAIREGVMRRFASPALPHPHLTPSARKRGGRGRRGRIRQQLYAGAWFRLPSGEGELDLLDRVERDKERARLLIQRYGVVFREVVVREPGHFKWREVFTALRLMELSGEVIAGHFFREIQGIQFCSTEALKLLEGGLSQEVIYWVSSVDPACASGLGLGDSLSHLPHRRSGSLIVFRGSTPVVVSTSGGKALQIYLEPGTNNWASYFEFFSIALTRAFAPRKSIEVETINDVRATMSPWRPLFAEIFDVSAGPRSIELRRRYSDPGGDVTCTGNGTKRECP